MTVRFVWDRENGVCDYLDFPPSHCLDDARDSWEKMGRPRCWLFAEIGTAPWSYYVAAAPPRKGKS